ncbi:hypothetical protein AB0B42_12530, partial [Streptomyces fradiae]|uniref:hypothetical protein n=1 Tax=Streptomyces fradiae TaxID=1906 RepID=UPI0033F0F1CA
LGRGRLGGSAGGGARWVGPGRGRAPAGGGGTAPAGEGAPGFGPGLDAARADAVLPVLDLLLGHRQPTEEECAGVPG